ncbi:Gfo/Idh/MocA family oxidoreductase [Kibdelosporangium philippinense]|uniref:Gfo/Idh/MocA family oxidoreductase n=1 Tax=Kibdelosporangium philippinense TaxID=211113 RepID=A0ABS8ZQ54_9PSEU|nr:Gfo/Idh/MocA family oxidoreductase [Kibdelosporangium philippinense]MCE7009070.1 Gfo/Idh/MocA family oxidoreductase [Kibdelosporangium philippinense]
MTKWGVVATGRIADVVTSDMALVPDADVIAVSSRSTPKAEEFAKRHGIPRFYGDYHDMLADPGIEVVYVATPHSSHYIVARNALLAGKAVLCEKPITVSLKDAERLVELARKHNVFLMEAMWTRFNPLIKRIRALVADGAIGAIRSVHADFGAFAPHDPTHRLWDPAAGGGSLLDLGVYPVSFAHMLLGEPKSIATHGTLIDGVDAEAALLLRYKNGVFAQLSSSLLGHYPIAATVVGTEGRIELPSKFYRPTEFSVVRPGEDDEKHELELVGHGYQYQIAEVVKRVQAGEIESPDMPHEETLAVMRTLDEALDKLGVSYP